MQIDLEEAIGLYAAAPFYGLRKHHYGCIVADPPWRFLTWSKKNQNRAAENHYKIMSLDDIKALPVADLAAKDSVLLLWVTDPLLQHGLAVMEAWGFRYKTVGFTWAKTARGGGYHMGTGFWTRANPEMCLLGTRGRPKRLSGGVRQLIVAPRREHSRKPDETLERVEKLVPGPYLEMFSRTYRPGWTTFGDEAGKFGFVESPTVASPSRVELPEAPCASSGSFSAA